MIGDINNGWDLLLLVAVVGGVLVGFVAFLFWFVIKFQG